jgi:hypothetical protein
MLTTIGWHLNDCWDLKLRDIVIAYHSVLLEKWDHTAAQLAMLHNIGIVILNTSGGKSKAKPKSMTDYHPFRRRTHKGMKITQKNFKMLRVLGNLICEGRR